MCGGGGGRREGDELGCISGQERGGAGQVRDRLKLCPFRIALKPAKATLPPLIAKLASPPFTLARSTSSSSADADSGDGCSLAPPPAVPVVAAAATAAATA